MIEKTLAACEELCGKMLQVNDRFEGYISLDSPFAQKLGFTSDKFGGYLWGKNGAITISLVESLEPGKGNFKRLLDNIEAQGYRIEIPSPSVRMTEIAKKRGLKQHFVYDEEMEHMVEVWK